MTPGAAHDDVREDAASDPSQRGLNAIEADAYAQFMQKSSGLPHYSSECTYKRARALADEPTSMLFVDTTDPSFVAAFEQAERIATEVEAMFRKRIVVRIALEIWRRR